MQLRRLWCCVVPLVLVGALIVGWIAAQQLPQLPDGDQTAIRQFRASVDEYAIAAKLGLFDVRHQFWYNLAGALLAVWLLDRLVRLWPARTWGRRGFVLLCCGGLLWLAGWGWTQTTGWEGELFLPPDVPVRLGPTGRPILTFDTFLIPPAPDGPGRSLAMRIRVNGVPATIEEEQPHVVQGWTLRPRWYGGLVSLPSGEPVYFGRTGTRTETHDGRTVTIHLDVETLALETVPDVEATASWYAIVTATFDPGTPLRRLAMVILGVGAGVWGWSRLSSPDATL